MVIKQPDSEVASPGVSLEASSPAWCWDPSRPPSLGWLVSVSRGKHVLAQNVCPGREGCPPFPTALWPPSEGAGTAKGPPSSDRPGVWGQTPDMPAHLASAAAPPSWLLGFTVDEETLQPVFQVERQFLLFPWCFCD